MRRGRREVVTRVEPGARYRRIRPPVMDTFRVQVHAEWIGFVPRADARRKQKRPGLFMEAGSAGVTSFG